MLREYIWIYNVAVILIGIILLIFMFNKKSKKIRDRTRMIILLVYAFLAFGLEYMLFEPASNTTEGITVKILNVIEHADTTLVQIELPKSKEKIWIELDTEQYLDNNQLDVKISSDYNIFKMFLSEIVMETEIYQID